MNPGTEKIMGRLKTGEKGFSLVELMLALVIFFVVSMAVYSLFESQSYNFLIQDQVSNMGQSVRTASSMMAREVRMAGFHALGGALINNLSSFVPSGFAPSVPMVVNLDSNPKLTFGGGAEPDMITFLAVLSSDTNPTTISAQVDATTIDLNLSSGETASQYCVGDIIHIGYASEYARVTAVSGNTLTIDTNPNISGNQGLAQTYASGTPVGEISVVTYAVFNEVNDPAYAHHTKGHPILVRKENAGGYQVLAENITDLKINTLGSGELGVALSARTSRADSKFPLNDGYRVLSAGKRIKLRNVDTIVTGSNCDLPAAPANLSIDSGLDAAYPCRINISWDAVTQDASGAPLSGGCAVTGYKVFFDTAAGVFGNSAEVGAATSYQIDVGSLPGCTYYVAVAAQNSGGAGAKSTEMSITDTLNPSQPTGLAATAAAGDNRVDLAWDAVAECDLAGYHVYRGAQPGGPYTQITGAPLSKSTESYVDNGLLGCDTYYYIIRAVDSCPNVSVASSEVSATTSDVTPPGMPGSLVYTQDPGAGTDTLTWAVSAEDGAGVNDVASYKIYGDGALLATLGAGSTTFTRATPTPRTIIYGVSAVDQYCGNESEKAEVTTCDQLCTLTISAPAEGQSLTGVVDIQGSVTDIPEGRYLSSVQIRIDNDPWDTVNGSTSWSYSWDTTLATNGPHRITVRATDNTGCFTVSYVNVTVANTLVPVNRLYVSVFECKNNGMNDVYVRVYVFDQDGNPVEDASISTTDNNGYDAFDAFADQTSGWYGDTETPDCGDLENMSRDTISGTGVSACSVQRYNKGSILFTAAKIGYENGNALISY